MNHLSVFIWQYLHDVKSMPYFLCHDPRTNLLPDFFCFWAKQKLTLRRFGRRLSSYCIFCLLRDLRLYFTYSVKTCCATMQILPQQRFSLCVPHLSGFVLIFRLIHCLCVCVCLLQYLSFPVKRAFARNGCFASWFSLPGKCLSNYPNNDPFQKSGKTR